MIVDYDWQVIRIPATSDATFDKLLAFGKDMEKVTVSCKVWPVYFEYLYVYEIMDSCYKYEIYLLP